MTDIIRSIRAELNLGNKVIDCYMLPDGEKRIGLAGASIAVGQKADYLSRSRIANTADYNNIKQLGFSDEIIEIEVILERGATRVKTISLSDFNVLLLYFGYKYIGKDSQDIKNNQEAIVSDRLASQLNGNREVCTTAGRIDVLTDSEIIEVKESKKWKSALGQILVYGHEYPLHKKRLHLFSKCSDSYLKTIKEHCNKFDVSVTVDWE